MTLFGFGKKKEKEINAPVCTCNGNCSVSETVEPENLNNCCQDIQGRICCIYRKSTTNTGDKRNAENAQKHRVYAGFRRFLIPQPT